MSQLIVSTIAFRGILEQLARGTLVVRVRLGYSERAMGPSWLCADNGAQPPREGETHAAFRMIHNNTGQLDEAASRETVRVDLWQEAGSLRCKASARFLDGWAALDAIMLVGPGMHLSPNTQVPAVVNTQIPALA